MKSQNSFSVTMKNGKVPRILEIEKYSSNFQKERKGSSGSQLQGNLTLHLVKLLNSTLSIIYSCLGKNEVISGSQYGYGYDKLTHSGPTTLANL